MNRKLIYLSIAAALLLPATGSAQYENVWAFGTRAGLDFNNGNPVPVVTGIQQNEGSASVCDAQGNLLFYTEGNKVWDRQHNLMPGGNGIVAAGESVTSVTQAALIVPVPGISHQYYLFSLSLVPPVAGYSPGKLYYSVIDMNLNNGLGDIAPGKKGIVIDNSNTLSEKLTAIPGPNCNIWVIVCRTKTNTYLAYEVNAAGINLTPVISGNGGTIAQGGYLTGSPDHKKLVTANDRMNLDQPAGLILSDFDPATGIVSNSIQLDNYEEYYGACFSPDNSKLYASITIDLFLKSKLWQYDLSASNPASAKVLLEEGEPNFISSIKQGPDRKIYIVRNSAIMGVINDPDKAGSACQYVPNGLRAVDQADYAQGVSVRLGLPNTIPVIYGTIDTVARYSILPSPGCFVHEMTLDAAATGHGYLWSNGGTGARINVTQPGIYWVRYSGGSCTLHIDSFEVHFSPGSLPATGTQGSCKNDSSGKAWVIPRPGDTVNYQYTWLDTHNTILTAGDSLINVPSGNYRLRITTADCDTLIPVLIPVTDYTVAFTTDTLICASDPLSFTNRSHPYFNHFTWRFGDNGFSQLENPVHTYGHPGTYSVTLVGKGAQCSDSAFAIVTADPAVTDTMFITDRDTICLGSGIFCAYGRDSTVTSLSWDFGDGGLPEQDKETVKHTYRAPGAMPVQLTIRPRACPERILTDTVHVFALPVVDLGPDTAVCREGFPFSLSNLAAADPADRYRWQTGATTRVLKINEYGRYSLSVTSGANCVATDEIEISKDCYLGIPNIFTPNGDGINDFFFPRETLAGNLVSFSMQIFNRWGQTVYETRDIKGQGWDGRYQSIDQPAGVFVYRIEAVFGNGREEKHQGNLTLLR